MTLRKSSFVPDSQSGYAE